MDEREVAIIAQVAAKEAGEMVRAAGALAPNTDSFGIFDGWYQHVAQAIVGSVRRSVVSPAPQSPQSPPISSGSDANGGGAVQQPNGTSGPSSAVFLLCGCGNWRRRLKSKRTGKYYWVNSDAAGNFSGPADFHPDCGFMEPANA